MKNSLTLFLLGYAFMAQAQPGRFGDSKYCNVNVNDNGAAFGSQFRKPCRDASFKVFFTDEATGVSGGCSGTLINRSTSDGDVGHYILTAGHCVGGINFDDEQTLYFNYQSPDNNNNSTPLTNQGVTDEQSGDINPITGTEVIDGFEYLHRTRLRLIARYNWGDFALLEILTPLPPHFNFTYSGWNPSLFNNGVVISPGGNSPHSYAGIHHPRGDIKKTSTANALSFNETPTASACYTVTTIINTLFGWIWGNTVSTSVICNYVDVPWLTISWNPFGNGITEGGSSGSGLFNGSNKQIGTLTGFIKKLSGCDFPYPEQYGKIRSNYFNQIVKTTLNPSNTVAVDLFGIGSRKITCYNNLELPGAPGVSGQYFPANHYGDDNLVVLSSQNNITTTQPIHIYPDAEYTFRAAGTIDLGPNFTVDPGATFIAEIGNCESSREPDPASEARERLKHIHLPQSLTYAAPDSVVFAKSNGGFSISLSPNPNSGTFKLQSAVEDRYNVRVMDVVGRVVHTSSFEGSQSTITAPEIPAGAYLVEITDGQQTQQLKMIVQ